MGMHPVWFDLLYLFVIIFVINYICDFKKKNYSISLYTGFLRFIQKS